MDPSQEKPARVFWFCTFESEEQSFAIDIVLLQPPESSSFSFLDLLACICLPPDVTALLSKLFSRSRQARSGRMADSSDS